MNVLTFGFEKPAFIANETWFVVFPQNLFKSIKIYSIPKNHCNRKVKKIRYQ